MGAAALCDQLESATVPVTAKFASTDAPMMAITAEAGLAPGPGEISIVVEQVNEPDAADEEYKEEEAQVEEPEPVAPEAQAPPTAEERLEAEREKDRKRFESRRAGRIYFVRHPRAPEDPGACGATLLATITGLC